MELLSSRRIGWISLSTCFTTSVGPMSTVSKRQSIRATVREDRRRDWNTVLNEVFCYIVSKLGDFQNLRHYAPRSKEDVETLVTSVFPAVPSTKHHIKLPKTSYLSKHFVAYIEALVGAAPYFRTTDRQTRG